MTQELPSRANGSVNSRRMANGSSKCLVQTRKDLFVSWTNISFKDPNNSVSVQMIESLNGNVK